MDILRYQHIFRIMARTYTFCIEMDRSQLTTSQAPVTKSSPRKKYQDAQAHPLLDLLLIVYNNIR